MRGLFVLCLLLVSCFLFNCDSGSSSTTMTLSFYATEDPGVIDIYVDGDAKGQLDHYSTDGFSVDCDAVEWPKAYLGVGSYFIEYYKNGARFASQDYTVTADDLGACIPLLAYP